MMNSPDVSLELYTPDLSTELEIPLSASPVSAGFPSPAENYMGAKLDLNRLLIRNPSSTYFARVSGVSMIDDGVDDGDLLIIDKSVEPFNGCLAMCCLDGEFTLKYFQREGDHGWLVPANKNYRPIRVDADNDFSIWGVVRYIIKKR